MVPLRILLLCALHTASSLSLQSQKVEDTKDAVLASAFGYPPNVGRNFICSLRRTDFKGDILLFMGTDDTPPPFKDSYNVIVHQISMPSEDRAKARMAQIQACSDGGYRYCMLADYRDVYFQRNPFERYPAGNDLVFAKESAWSGTLGSEYHNKAWITKCVGYDRLKNHAQAGIFKRPVVCSGTIAGTPAGLKALGEAIEVAFTHMPACHGGPLDQSLLNILLFWASKSGWNSMVPMLAGLPFQLQQQGAGLVNTIGSIPRVNISTNVKGEFLDWDGTVSPVVHQYERDALGFKSSVDARFQTCTGFDS